MNVNAMISVNDLKNQSPRFICLAAFCLCIFTFLSGWWQWHADWELAHQIIAPPSLATSSEMVLKIAALPSAHLFGQRYHGNIPISNLQLRVTGIVKLDGDNAAASKVYISTAGGASKIYQSGDFVTDGVKIYDITADTVMLETDGHLEKLSLPRQKLIFKSRESLGE